MCYFITSFVISSWENGKTQPDIDTIFKIAQEFDVPVEDVIYGKRKNNSNVNVNIGSSSGAKGGIGFGVALAMVISYVKWQSIGWAVLHGLLNWFYVIYYVIKYGWN